MSLLDAIGNCLPMDQSLTDDQKRIVSPPPSTLAVAAFIRHAGRRDISLAAAERRQRRKKKSNHSQDAGCITIEISTAQGCFCFLFFFVFCSVIIHPSWSQGFVILQPVFSAHCRFKTDNGPTGPCNSLRIRTVTSHKHLISPPGEVLQPAGLHLGLIRTSNRMRAEK